MKRSRIFRAGVALALSVMLSGPGIQAQVKSRVPKPTASTAALEKELLAKYGEGQRERLARGLKQVGQFWKSGDGDAKAFEEFVRSNFAGDSATQDALFERLELAMESIDGNMLEINRDFRMQSDLDRGPIYPFDEVLAGYDPSAHVNDDFFANKLAFVVLLNFPLTTLEQRLAEGERWSRRQWCSTSATGA